MSKALAAECTRSRSALPPTRYMHLKVLLPGYVSCWRGVKENSCTTASKGELHSLWCWPEMSFPTVWYNMLSGIRLVSSNLEHMIYSEDKQANVYGPLHNWKSWKLCLFLLFIRLQLYDTFLGYIYSLLLSNTVLWPSIMQEVHCLFLVWK